MSVAATGRGLRLVERIRGARLRASMQSVVWAWCFGAVFYAISVGAPLTVFARTMGASTAAFGFLAALPFLTMLIQLPASYFVEALQHRKPFFLATAYAQRLLWVLIACVPWLFGWLGSAGQVTALIVLVSAASLLGACAAPAWWSWLSMLVPERVRGRYIARRATIGLWLSIPAVLLAGLLLDWASGGGTTIVLAACSLVFLAAAVCGVMDIRVIDRRVAEPAKPPQQTRLPLRAVLTEPLADVGFRRYLLYTLALNASVGMLIGYLWLYVLEDIGVTKSVAGIMLMICPSLGLAAATNGWGLLNDRYGRKATLLCASMLTVLLPAGWLMVHPGLFWPGFILTFVGGVGWAGVQQANTNIVLAYSERTGRSTYSAVWSMAIAVGIALGAGLSVLIVLAFEHTGLTVGGVTLSFYQLQFVGSTLVRLVAIGVLLPRIEDIEAKPTAHNVRLILHHIYGMLDPRRVWTVWANVRDPRRWVPRRKRPARFPSRRSRAA